MTDEQLIPQLQGRDDLTEVEHELLDRLIRAHDTIEDLEGALSALRLPVVEPPSLASLVDTRVPTEEPSA